MNKDSYSLQDRGGKGSYDDYLAAMDAVSVEKVASASAFFNPAPGNVIVDVGMASGTSSNILALLFPDLKIVGVDINPTMIDIARKTYQQPNLEFRLDDGEKLGSFQPGTVSGFFNCSAIHHITSFNGYEPSRAYNTLKRQAELLNQGGIVVVRDFVKPPEKEVILEISNLPEGEKPSDAELLISFSKTARSLACIPETGFPLREIVSPTPNYRRFRLFYADAVEFIRRKDYFENWDIELQEEYGYFTQAEFEEVFVSLGLRIVVSNPIYNPWIIKNRYKNKFSLYDNDLNNIGFPPTNYLIAGEKVVNKGTKLSLVRHLPDSGNPFLKFASYLAPDGQKIYDVVKRPNSVMDIIPYYFEDGKLYIIAKHGYPRPLVNIGTDSPIIDQKHFSGYITEGLTSAYNQNLEQILQERANISADSIRSSNKSLEYFTSPGGIDEKVESFLVEIDKVPHWDQLPEKNVSGFADSGTIRKYDALQLLKTAQTGALLEARLELNLYHLIKKLNIKLPKWLGEVVEVHDLTLPEVANFNEFTTRPTSGFKEVTLSAGYLQKHRAKFTEEEVGGSANILEYVTPSNVSLNTLVALPVAKYNNTLYVGLEQRELPVPQIHTGNSKLFTAPAFRLPKSCSGLKELENYISALNIYGATITSFNKLGEKFFPSVGVTPEQVYPYVVSLSDPTAHLKWFNLKELYDNLELINDGHLLVSLFRLVQALS